MKKNLYTLIAALAIAALSLSGSVPGAQAAVNVTAQPVSFVASPESLPADSGQTELFSFSLSANAGETLSGVSVQINAANASTTVTGSHIASVALYQDNGSNSFNPSLDALVGSQTAVNVGSPTVIAPATTTPASGEFYISLATAGDWSGSDPADSITVTLPANAILTSANSPVINAATTSAITAQAPGTVSVTVVKYLNGAPATAQSADNNTFSVNISSDGSAGNFDLGPVGVNTTASYQVVTTLPYGANSYSAYENIFGAVGSACSSGLPYTLSGYSYSSTSLAAAAGQTLTATPPSFSDLQANEYVIVWNSSCAPVPTPTPTPTPTPPTISSTVSVSTQLSASSVATNTPVYDAAVLSNATANAGGTVTYNVYAGSQCSGSAVFSSTQSVTNGVVPVSGDFTPTAAGTYYWQAYYSGDANNNSAASGCGSEVLTVNQSQPGTNICSNGLINGRIYHLTGSDEYYIAETCALQTLFGGKINFHGRKNQFRGMIQKNSVQGLLGRAPAPQYNYNDNGGRNSGKINIQANVRLNQKQNVNVKANSHSGFSLGAINFGKLFSFGR